MYGLSGGSYLKQGGNEITAQGKQMYTVLDVRGGIYAKTEFDIWGAVRDGLGEQARGCKLSCQKEINQVKLSFGLLLPLKEGPPESSILRAV